MSRRGTWVLLRDGRCEALSLRIGGSVAPKSQPTHDEEYAYLAAHPIFYTQVASNRNITLKVPSHSTLQ